MITTNLFYSIYVNDIPLLRHDLRTWRIHTAPGYEEQAEVVNIIFPLLIDMASDEELKHLMRVIMGLNVVAEESGS